MHVATAQQWFSAARPRTLPAAVAPVLVGTGAGIALGGFSWLRGGLALLVSLALQVGVNYSNDYSDGIRGTDADRVGPTRLVGAGLAAPVTVKLAAFGCFGVAGVAGLILAALTSWWLIPVGHRRGGGRLVLHRRARSPTATPGSARSSSSSSSAWSPCSAPPTCRPAGSR